MATRTLGLVSKQYTLASFRVSRTKSPSSEGDRCVADLCQIASKDPFWSTPDIETLFPNAKAILKAKADALEAE